MRVVAPSWLTRLLHAVALLVLLNVSAHAQAQVAGKVALVIGNSNYKVRPLANPGKDAQAVGQSLAAMGYAVVDLRDGSRQQMERAIAEAGRLLQGHPGTALLFYAGHGLQLDWRNYLVPVDARIETAADVPGQTIDLQQVIDTFKSSGSRVNVLVLDACRDNPFGQVTASRGLAPMDAPPGTFLAYATAPGNVAEDGSASAGNSLYTRFLLQELAQREARIEDIFKRVRLQVRKASQGRQIPWESTSLEGDLLLGTGRMEPTAVTDIDRLESEFTVEKAAWDAIKTSSQADDFYAFLHRHPGGFMAELAQFKLDQLQARQLAHGAEVSRIPTLASGKPRWRLGDLWVRRETDRLSNTSSVQRLRVTALEGDQVIFNRGSVVFNQMGAVLKNRYGVKDPPVLIAPADIAIGKRWRNAFRWDRPDGSFSYAFDQNRVVAFEEIDLPGGRMPAYRVERHTSGKGGGSAQETFWVEPSTMRVVRFDRIARNARHQVTENNSVVEESFTPGP